MNRRDFLESGAAAGLALAATQASAQQPAPPATGRPQRVGLIGCGWYGKCDLLRLIQVAPVEVVSLCDVDPSHARRGRRNRRHPRSAITRRPRTFADYREMLRQRDLDIVLIATPDHWHALPMIAAVEAGADVWVQKPISVDIVEGQAMVAAARRTRQGRPGRHAAAQHAAYHRRQGARHPGRPAGQGRRMSRSIAITTCGPATIPRTCQPPANLDYEMWTGPAPMRPYNRLVHPRSWRAFMEYGNGIVGDMCIHMLDMVRWMLGLGWPKSVSSSGGILVDRNSKANITDTQGATFDYGDRQIVWQHRTWGTTPDPRLSLGRDDLRRSRHA